MNSPKAILTPKGERWFRSGHPWIFSDDISSLDNAVNGEIAALYNPRNLFLGWGFYSRHSRISFRVITQSPGIPDQVFWREILQKAINRRKKSLDYKQACRVVFSEADGIPGLIADWYAGHLVIQTLIPGIDRILKQLCDLFQELLKPSGILLRNDFEARSLEQLPREVRTLYGQVPEKVLIEEGPIQYEVDLVSGQKTGAYLDQKENRLHLASYPQSQGLVLDCFCYTGGFALHLAGKAKEVVAVDDSASALEWGRRNAGLNGFDRINFLKNNIFDFLKEANEQGLKFDLIILDPPPFARKKSAVVSALRGYQELNLRALRCLNSEGILSTYSCSYNITESLFGEMLSHAAQKTGGKIILLEKRMQAGDHPVLLNFPESLYLKGLIVQKT